MLTFVLVRPSSNNNPTGVGGSADRPWDRWRVGDPGRACSASSKRTGVARLFRFDCETVAYY
jgi:hypothetical protein